MSYLSYRGSLWKGADKIESENHGGNNISENSERKNSFEVERVGHKNYVIWNYKYSESIHVDLNHNKSNQPISADYKNIISVYGSANIGAIEKILTLPVHLVHTTPPVPAPPIFSHGPASEAPPPSH